MSASECALVDVLHFGSGFIIQWWVTFFGYYARHWIGEFAGSEVIHASATTPKRLAMECHRTATMA